MEVIVANCCGQQFGGELAALHPTVKVIPVNADCSIAQARGAGIRWASGEVIAVLHERYTVTKDWVRVVLESQSGDCDVVGGCVGPSRRLSPAAWAMYLSEYAHIAPPMPGGPLDFREATMLPGGNVSYKRQVFGLASMEDALWELDFHAKLFRKGARFVRNPEIRSESEADNRICAPAYSAGIRIGTFPRLLRSCRAARRKYAPHSTYCSCLRPGGATRLIAGQDQHACVS